MNYDTVQPPGSPPFTTEVPIRSEPRPLPTKTPKFTDDVNGVYYEAKELLVKKHRDYGPKNIALSPGGPLNGLRVRIWDKMARINNLIESGSEPQNESIRDSFLDLLNYSAIALLVIDGKWPEK